MTTKTTNGCFAFAIGDWIRQTYRKQPDAEFIGWQDTTDDEGHQYGDPFPLFNIRQPNHPRYGSTVCDKELRSLGLLVPNYPTFEEYKNKTA